LRILKNGHDSVFSHCYLLLTKMENAMSQYLHLDNQPVCWRYELMKTKTHCFYLLILLHLLLFWVFSSTIEFVNSVMQCLATHCVMFWCGHLNTYWLLLCALKWTLRLNEASCIHIRPHILELPSHLSVKMLSRKIYRCKP
jgi:hypothetical protein